MNVEAHIRHSFSAFDIDVSFSVDRAGVTVLFGPSGSGKTTVINALAGLFRPREGRIVIGDRTVLDTKRGVFVPASERRIGYVFQDARLFPHMNVRDNLRFGQRRAGHTGNSEKTAFADIVSLLGLDSLLHRKPAKLSGGERGRVALGRALLAGPALLLLDEPLAALDAPRREEILPYLEMLRDRARIPMFHVTHSVEELSRLADEVFVFDAGRIARKGSVFDLLSDLEFAGLSGTQSCGSVIQARVSERRDTEGLTMLAFDGGELAVPYLESPLGTSLRIRVRAEDILLARARPVELSANNVLPAIVSGIRSPDGVHADVGLSIGGTRLIARITRSSLVRLGITANMPIFAIVKSVTIDPRGAGVGYRRN